MKISLEYDTAIGSTHRDGWTLALDGETAVNHGSLESVLGVLRSRVPRLGLQLAAAVAQVAAHGQLLDKETANVRTWDEGVTIAQTNRNAGRDQLVAIEHDQVWPLVAALITGQAARS